MSGDEGLEKTLRRAFDERWRGLEERSEEIGLEMSDKEKLQG